MMYPHPDEPNATMREVQDEQIAEQEQELIYASHTVDSLYNAGYLDGYIEQLAIDLHEQSGYVNYEEAELGARAKVKAMTMDDLWYMTPEPLDWSRVLEDLR